MKASTKAQHEVDKANFAAAKQNQKRKGFYKLAQD